MNVTIKLGDHMTIIKWFFRYLKTYKKEMVKSTFYMFLESLVEVFIPIIMAFLINNGIQNNDRGFIIVISVLLIILIIIGIVGSVLNSYYSSSISSSLSFDLRKDVFASICDRKYKDLDSLNVSKSITIFSNDIATIGTVVLYFIRLFLKIIFIFIISIIMSIIIAPKFLIIIITVVPICVVLFYLIFKYAFPYFDLTQTSVDNLNHVVRENISGIKFIKTLNQEKREIKRFSKINNELKILNIKAMKLVMAVGPILQFLIYSATFIVLIYSNHLVQNNQIQIGTIMAFLQYLSMILSSLLSGAMILLLVLKSWVSLKRIYELVQIEENVNIRNFKLSKIQDIEFKNVSFSYGNSKEKVLSNLNFKIKCGEKIAIIGRCGSGKSTLLKLIANLYEVTSGKLIINNQNINCYDEKSLRKNILYMNQNSPLFSGTIKTNISFFKKGKIVDKVLESSDVSSILENKKDGLLSKVESFGNNFSGGEKNRIVLARALFQNVDVLLFDDVLSAVDIKTEKKIWKSIKENYSKHTIIQVNSRLSNLSDMDKIILLENGKIEAIGTFEEIKDNDLFKQFYELQKESK